MADTNNNPWRTRDCKQYYHLGLDIHEDDDNGDFDEEVVLDLKDDETDAFKTHNTKPSLADELEDASRSNGGLAHPSVTNKPVMNVIVNNNIDEAEDKTDPVVDVVVRSQPLSQDSHSSHCHWKGQDVHQGHHRRVVLQKALNGTGIAHKDVMVTCGKTCCSIS